MNRLIDLTGQRFGRLSVVCKCGSDKYGAALWQCKCECGKTVTKRGSALRAGHAKSCGCLHDELSSLRMAEQNRTHAMSNTRLYEIWSDLKRRCSNPNHRAFDRYGGRGIKFCAEWAEFLPFYVWSVANGYSETLTIERVDNDGDYCPENCRWATRKDQANNKSITVFYELDGVKYTLPQLCEKCGISYGTLYTRINKHGWSVKAAITTPVRGGGR